MAVAYCWTSHNTGFSRILRLFPLAAHPSRQLQNRGVSILWRLDKEEGQMPALELPATCYSRTHQGHHLHLPPCPARSSFLLFTYNHEILSRVSTLHSGLMGSRGGALTLAAALAATVSIILYVQQNEVQVKQVGAGPSITWQELKAEQAHILQHPTRTPHTPSHVSLTSAHPHPPHAPSHPHPCTPFPHPAHPSDTGPLPLPHTPPPPQFHILSVC